MPRIFPAEPTSTARTRATPGGVSPLHLAAVFLLGVVVTLYFTSPRSRAYPVQEPPTTAVVLGNSSLEAAHAAGGTRAVEPVELRRDTLAPAISPRELPAIPAPLGTGIGEGALPPSKSLNGAFQTSPLGNENTLRSEASLPHTQIYGAGAQEFSAAKKPAEFQLEQKQAGQKTATNLTALPEPAPPEKDSEIVLPLGVLPPLRPAGDKAASGTVILFNPASEHSIGGSSNTSILQAESANSQSTEAGAGFEPEKTNAESDPNGAGQENGANAAEPLNGPLQDNSPVSNSLPDPSSVLISPPPSADEGPTKPAPAARKLSAAQLELRSKLQRCLDTYYREPISVNDFSPWGNMHCMLAFGVDSQLYGPRSEPVNAIGWLCFNGRSRDLQLFKLDKHNQLEPQIGPGVQGHAGQFLAMLAQSRVQQSYPLRVGGRSFTVADLLETEMRTCRDKTELTFKLIAFSHYLPTDHEWQNDLGETWNFTRLLRQELAAPIIGAACGGTHRLMGYTYAVNKRRKEGLPLDGQFARADKYLCDYQKYIFSLQTAEGGFSTNWFAGPANNGDLERKLQTGGHMLEWFLASLPTEELDNPRVLRSVHWLADTLLEHRGRKWAVGPRGHALRALVIYDERVYGAIPGQRRTELATPLIPPASQTR